MVEPGAPGQRPRRKGVPKAQGVPKTQGVPRQEGTPPEQGVAPAPERLPQASTTRLPGTAGQISPGTPGQMHKHAENPWAPDDETVLHEEDQLIPPSSPDRDA